MILLAFLCRAIYNGDMEKYDNYIWDFDGTLFESYKRMSLAFWKALQGYMAAQGKPFTVTQQEIRGKMKQSVGYAWRWYQQQYQLPESVMEEYRKLERYMKEEPFSPFPDTRPVLQALQDQGARHFVYTHRGPEAKEYLEQFDLHLFFQGMVTAADGFPPKPAPEALLYLMKSYQMDPEKTLMVGDRTIDIQAAHRAGIKGCLLDPEGEISGCVCEYHIQNLKELIV